MIGSRQSEKQMIQKAPLSASPLRSHETLSIRLPAGKPLRGRESVKPQPPVSRAQEFEKRGYVFSHMLFLRGVATAVWTLSWAVHYFPQTHMK